MTREALALAAIDIGTNSVRLLIVDATGREIQRIMRMTRLGQGVDQSRTLTPDAIERTAKVLEQFALGLREHGVVALRMTATSAARDAVNRDVFFARVFAIFGQTPELLSGADEARLSFLGATKDLPPVPRVVFDLGGGSTEFALGTLSPERSVSVDVGCVRITERFLKSDPPTKEELNRARACVREELMSAEQALKLSGNESWVGLAGTVSAFAAHALLQREYDARATHRTVLTREAIQAFAEELYATPIAERRSLLAEPQRAEVIAGGAVVLTGIVEHFALSSIVTSEQDILDGLVQSLRNA